jgi:hypothetical protein
LAAFGGQSGNVSRAAVLRAQLIRDERGRHDWSIAQSARALIEASSELRDGDLQTVVAAWKRWERGVRPRSRYRGLLSAVLGVDRRLLADDEAMLAWASDQPKLHDGPVLGQDGSLARATEDEDVRRRRFLELAGVAMLSGLDDRLELVRRGFDWVLGAEPSSLDVEDWERTAHAYGRESVALSPAQLLPNLVAEFDELRALLSGPLPAVAERDLTRVAGQLAALIAINQVGLGEHQAARRWWRTARRAADRARDPALQAFVRGRQAVMALYAGHRPAEILLMAEDAVAASRGIPCAGAVSGLAAEAQASSLMADAKRARATLGTLSGVFERLPDDVAHERSSEYGWSEQRLRHVESYVFTRLGESKLAQRAQDQADKLYPATNRAGRTQVRLHRAECLIIDGDVTEGARYAASVLEEQPQDQRTEWVMELARTALAAIPAKARSVPEVREYRALLADAAR